MKQKVDGILMLVAEFFEDNMEGVIASIIASIMISVVVWFYKVIKNAPKNINEILNSIDYNSLNWRDDLDNALQVKKTMTNYFPDYNDYLLIQYGSSVSADSDLPSDYDFIVLMLGYSKQEIRYMHNKGTTNDISESENKYDVDIVFRDYFSFLFAASAGMPYENSVITGGKLIKGREGYFQWLKNITQNILFDKDFLLRRYKEKIIIEKQEFQKCINEHKQYNHDKYYVIRSGYYYITSLLQFKRIENYNKVITQENVVQLSKVRNFYDDFSNQEMRGKYVQLVENLKRNKNYDSIMIDDILKIIKYVQNGEGDM